MNNVLKNIVSVALVFSLLLSTTGFVVFEHFCACDGENYTSFIPDECCSITNENKVLKESCCELGEIQEVPCCEGEKQIQNFSEFDSLNQCSCFSDADYHSSDQFYVVSKVNFEPKINFTSEFIYSKEIVKNKNLVQKSNEFEIFASLNNFGISFLIKTHQLKIPTIS